MWVLLNAGASFFLVWSRNGALKNRLFAPYILLAAALFMAYAVAAAPRWWVVAVALPFIALVAYTKLRPVRFCDVCGRACGNDPDDKEGRCPGCGAEID